MKIIAQIASNVIDSDNDKFSDEAIKEMAETKTPLPITMNFDPINVIGKVNALSLKDNKLMIEGELFNISNLTAETLKKLFAVPGGKINKFHKEGKIKVYESISLTSIGITPTPSDTSITSIQVKADDKNAG